jgi:hypothetical protein
MKKKTRKTNKTKKAKKASTGAFRRLLLWGAVFLALLLAADQALMRLTFGPSLLREFQLCYRDFRCRLPGGFCSPAPQAPETIEAAIAGGSQRAQGAVRSYLYVDGQGTLQFADRLEDIPLAYRSEAQPLAD